MKSKTIIKRHFSLFQNIRVLDLSRILAGPFATMYLSDLGAEIIKIEPFSGDETRKWGPPFVNPKDELQKSNLDSSYFLSVNRNKKSICVDLKKQLGQEIIHDLALKSDIIVENFSQGVT